MNFGITAGTGRTSVPSNATPVTDVQQHNGGGSPSDIAEQQQQQQQQPKMLPALPSASIASSDGTPRSWSGPYNNSEGGMPIPPPCPFPKEIRMAYLKKMNNASNNINDDDNTKRGIRNQGYNNDNNNEDFPIENHNKVNDDNTKGDLLTTSAEDDKHNLTQNHRSLSEASFGSFSMGEETTYESDGNNNFSDALAAPNDMAAAAAAATSVPVVHDATNNALPPHQTSTTTNVPQIFRATNDNPENNSQSDPRPQQPQTLLMGQPGKKKKAPILDPPPSTTTTTNNFSNRRIHQQSTEENRKENNEQLKRYETSLLALDKMQNNQTADETASQTALALKNPVATETQDDTARIAQPLKNNPQQQQRQQQQQKPSGDEVIELLDNDVVVTTVVKPPSMHPEINAAVAFDARLSRRLAGIKRSRPADINNTTSHPLSKPIVPGSSLHGYQYAQMPNNTYRQPAAPPIQQQQQQPVVQPDVSSEPQYINLPSTHIPTWDNPLPPIVVPQQRQSPSHMNRYKRFELSLLNVSEFTITGLPVSLDGMPSSVLGFRKIVKEVSRGHGKAVFERDNPKKNDKNDSTDTSSAFGAEQYSSYGENKNPDGGKWRIPLGAYRAFYSYLQSDRMCKVDGIPEDQLKIASLGKARLEKGFPSAKKIIKYGVPKGLATALAPFQRGGVEFIVEKHGRALLADDMGLGKTIQSIASMSVYHDEWPLLILTPSTARYHWAAEFNNWLGLKSSVNNETDLTSIPEYSMNEEEEKPGSYEEEEEDTDTTEPRKPMRLLEESEIHVMIAGKEKMFPTPETRIVICSYGLATSLVESGKLYKHLFKCAIVDESHMLKNIKTKRTSKLVPILHATSRCILLSGTPALASPTELWPQLKILSTERDGWWDNEDEFLRKYVQRSSAIRRAELHTMLTGTLMIRRMKHDILKSLPSKQREKAIVDVLTPDLRREFHNCMKLLREGKGVMAKIAKRHPVLPEKNDEKDDEKEIKPIKEENNMKLESLKAEYNERCRQTLHNIRFAMQSIGMNQAEKENLVATYFKEAKIKVDVWYKERVDELKGSPSNKPKEEELDRKTILNKMYSMTAKAKIPLIAELVGKWLEDPTKGKLCIFAHHIYVLDEIVKRVGLSNKKGSRKRFIRIDGSTNPKERQAQIVAFQSDPDIRIAVLGITAAGVAVTLTASSTVWFAELFWTPALMIQAEDRCHRIGQNAAVKCLYFVATGTLDVLLWDLLEKKFQDLGEFVEGREKMKIVVHKTYKSVKELKTIFIRPDDGDVDDDAKQNENDPAAEGDDLIKLESDLQEDIVQLAHEEMGMISQGEDEDGGDNKTVGTPTSAEKIVQSNPGVGQTEDEAICLSDSDEDDTPTDSNEVAKSKIKDNTPAAGSGGGNSFNLSKSRVLNKCRVYKQYFGGSTFGIQLLYVGHRLAVANNRFGKLKPALGDVLVAVNGHRLPVACPLDHACKFMKQVLNKGTVELIFLEDEAFAKHCSPFILEQRKSFEAAEIERRNKKAKNPPPTNTEDVIELLDDD